MSATASKGFVTAPPAWLTALEVRAIHEREIMRLAMPLLERLPRGDGHPVFVMPGFTADDRSTQPMRALLRSLGYWAKGWGLGPNLGPTQTVVDGVVEAFERLADRGRKISIIGWSLGGIYARELAYQYPDAVRQVITLGSPIQMVDGDKSAVSDLWDSLHGLYEMPPIAQSESHLEQLDIEEKVLETPSTAVYSRGDGIVHWRTCLDRPGPRSENVEVYGSHSGLGVNTSVMYVLADRLAQPEDGWEPFRAAPALRSWFPRPAEFRPRLVDTAA